MALQVIGAGLGRTGTLSFKLALEHLGFGPCYHMVEVFAGDVRKTIPQWMQAAEGNPDWPAIFDGFQSTADYPGCGFWRELADFYPEAKVVLTTRDPESWFNSVSETIFSKPHRDRFSSGPMEAFMNRTIYAEFKDRIDDRAFMIEFFQRHSQRVIDAIPADRLLVYSVKEGWEPLCSFLGVDVPPEPFPRVNSREEMAANTDDLDIGGPEDLMHFARAYRDSLREQAFGANA